MSPIKKFDKAVQNITQERGKIYGNPADTFAEIQIMKSMVAGCKDAAIRHALEMICVKLVRIAETPTLVNIDNVIDIAGYARCMVIIMEQHEGGESEE
jgi:hypothetical protein